MGMEIERKFLVRSDGWKGHVTGRKSLVQGYLSSHAKVTVRVRIEDGRRGLLTLKGRPDGLARPEFEYEIPLEDARDLMGLAEPHVVAKTRHLVPHGGLVWEVDVFTGRHAGLVLAEVELDRQDQAIILPDWIGPEVSWDDRYNNASLARDGILPADPA
ncbi:CYTH domain-containing protein [Devosia sp.]|uniref:CYTH domain-containing protein n=1 Tax=Devosia sp. TaxID=1871048 RepID=UPI002B002048|nr:CYTH domain-containing protein [Devosia sp.]